MDQFSSSTHEAAMGDSDQMSLVETAREAINHAMKEPVDGRRGTFSFLRSSSQARPASPIYRGCSPAGQL
ncbi:unnamed protein product [Linum tenue]|uniref:Uncharacterized protein n=1 Tax=Linum tenue TaxID=586396 RepID=A0AAV0R6D6_9ROSI|nr:unnamed protein product [Linum tenue]